MDMSDIPSAKLVLLKNIKNCKKGDSIRITGIWKEYDETSGMGIIRYGDYAAEVDMNQIDTIPRKGDTVLCLGEVVIEEATSQMLRMNARIIKKSNTLDMDLYEKVVEVRNSVI